MSRYKSFFPLVAGLLVGAVLIGLAFWQLQRERRESRQALTALRKIKQEVAAMTGRSPAPSEENAQAIGRELAKTQEWLDQLNSALLPSDNDSSGTAERNSTEAYFEITTFVEKMRAHAAASQVALKPGERFGFAGHDREGPGPELAREVLSQCHLLQGLLEALLEARPTALLAVQRQHPGSLLRRERSPAGAAPESGDFFTLPEALSLKLPDEWCGQAFRFEFSGQTQVLRAFLNKLALGNRPVFVRNVAVEPLNEEKTAGGVVGSGLARNLSRFSVVVETVAPTAAPEKPAT